MPKYEECLPALEWRRSKLKGPVSAERLVEDLTEVPYTEFPNQVVYRAMTNFRHLNAISRIRAARRFLRDATPK